MRVLWLWVLVCLLPATGFAGPWPREKGQVFAAFSHSMRDKAAAISRLRLADPQSYTSAYIEYGMAPRLTFGLDAGYAQDGGYSAIVFARRAFGRSSGAMRYGVHLGAGVERQVGGKAGAQVQLGAGIGRGFMLRSWSGWVSLDVSATWRAASSDVVGKADLTLGLKPNDNWKTILQLQSGQYPGQPAYLRLAPSVVRRIGGNRHVELGLDADLIGGDRVGVKFGTWMSF